MQKPKHVQKTQYRHLSARLTSVAVLLLLVFVLAISIGSSAWNLHHRVDGFVSGGTVVEMTPLVNDNANAILSNYVAYETVSDETVEIDWKGSSIKAYTYGGNAYQPHPYIQNIDGDIRDLDTNAFTYEYYKWGTPKLVGGGFDEITLTHWSKVGSEVAPHDAGIYQCIISSALTGDNAQYNRYIGSVTVTYAILPRDISLIIHAAQSFYGETVAQNKQSVFDDISGDVGVITALGDNLSDVAQIEINSSALAGSNADNSILTVGTYKSEGVDISYNYNVTFVGKQFEGVQQSYQDYVVLPREIYVRVKDATSTYGNALQPLSMELTNGSTIVSGDSLADIVRLYMPSVESLADGARLNVGDYVILASAFNGEGNKLNENYDVKGFIGSWNVDDENKLKAGTYKVTKRTIDVTIQDKASIYGNELQTLTCTTADAIANSDGLANIVQLSNTATSTSNVGKYPISRTQLSTGVALNYVINFTDGNYTINVRPISVTIADKSSTYGDSIVTLTASTTDLVANNVGIYNIVELATTATKRANVGTYPISGEPKSGYPAENFKVTFTNGTYTINIRSIDVTITNVSSDYGNSLVGLVCTTEDSIAKDVVGIYNIVELSTTATASSNAGSYPISGEPKSGYPAENFAVTFAGGTYTINPRAITVNIDNKSGTYGDDILDLTCSTQDSVANGVGIYNIVTPSTTAVKTSNAGSYPITGTRKSGFPAENFAVDFVDGTYTINKAVLTITANDLTINYGATPTYTVDYSGFKFTGDKTKITGTVDFSSSTYVPGKQNGSVGTYPIIPSLAEQTNYTINPVNGTLTVERVALTLKLKDKTVTYGDAIPTFEVNSTGFVLGESIATYEFALSSDNCLCSYTANSPVVESGYPITWVKTADYLSNNVFKNYNVTIQNGLLTVIPAAITNIDVAGISNVYSGEQQNLIATASATTVNSQAYTFTYCLTENGTYTSTVSATNVGTYTVYYKVTAPNHTEANGSVVANITNATITDISVVGINEVYTGSAKNLVSTASANTVGGQAYTFTYCLTENGTYTTTVSATNVGTYTVYYKVSAPNHTGVSGSVVANITNATITNVSVVGIDEVYTGSAKNLVSTASATTVNNQSYTFTYCLTSNGSYTNTISATNAGDYTIYYKVAAPNHSEASGQFTSTIANATMTVDVAGLGYVGIYDGISHNILTSIPTASTVDGCAVRYEYKRDGGEYSTTMPAVKNVDDSGVFYIRANADNHNSVEGSVTVTITALGITITANNASSYYGEAEETLTCTIKKTADNTAAPSFVNSELDIHLSRGTDNIVGEYEITITVSAKQGYNLANYTIQTANGTYTIIMSELSLTLNDVTVEYGGEPIYSAVAVRNGVTLNDSEFVALLSSLPEAHPLSYYFTCAYTQTTPVSASPLTIYWQNTSVIEEALPNYNIQYTNGQLVIIKASVAVPSADNTVYTFNGHGQTYYIPTSTLYTVSGNVQTNAGTYTVTVALNDNANYKWAGATGLTESANKTYSFVINQYDIDLSTIKWVYDGSYDMPQNNIIPDKSGATHTLTLTGFEFNPQSTFAAADFSIAYTDNTASEYVDGGYTTTATITFSSNFNVHTGNTVNTSPHILTIDWNLSTILKITKPSANTTVFTYSGVNQTYTLPLNENYTITNNVQKDAGTYTVKVSLNDVENATWDDDSIADLSYTFTINKKNITVNANAILSSVYRASFRTMAATTVDSQTHTVFDNAAVEGDIAIFNGLVNNETLALSTDYQFTKVFDGNSYFQSTATSKMVGTTYRAYIELKSAGSVAKNYTLSSSNNFCILKYKTVKVGSTYYTIEDALAQSGSTIILEGGSPYVETKFSYFTAADYSVLTNYAADKTYNISGKTLIVPGTSGTPSDLDKPTENHSATSTYVPYSVLWIKAGMTLNFTGSSRLYIGAVISGNAQTYTYVHSQGVVMNDGSINFASGCKLNSYGYIKTSSAESAGFITLQNGATGTEVLQIFDWIGGNSASKVYSKAFPTNAWSLHNISCPIKIYSGATYIAYAAVDANSSIQSTTATIIGSSSSGNSLFYPTSVSTNNYIIKRATRAATTSENANALYSVTGCNSIKGQKDIIEIYGNYNDNSLLIEVYVKMQTSTSKSAPIGYMDVKVMSGANLSLTKSDYVFMPGTKLFVADGATVTIGSSVDVAFLSLNAAVNVVGMHKNENKSFYRYCVDNEDAYAEINGTLTVNGKISGKLITSGLNGKVTLSNVTPATFTTMTGSYGLMEGSGKTYYYSGDAKMEITAYIYSNGEISSDMKSIAAGEYKSICVGGRYGWFTTKGDVAFCLNDDNSTILKTMSNATMPYVINTADYPVVSATKDYYYIERDASNNIVWYADSACTRKLNIGDSLYCGTTLYLCWKPVEYTIQYQYVYDGVTASDVNKALPSTAITFTAETAGSLPLPDIFEIDNLDDYTLDGWFADSACTTKVSTANEILSKVGGASQDITLYAKWTQYTPSFRVTFVDGVGSHPEIVTYAAETVVVSQQQSWTPSANYTVYDRDYGVPKYFEGWYFDSACTQPFTNFSGIAQDQDQVLYAKWVEKQTLMVQLMNSNRVGYQTFSIFVLYYKPGTEFTVKSLSEWSNGEYTRVSGEEANAHSYWELIGGTDENGTKYQAGNRCTLNDATYIRYSFHNRYEMKLTSSDNSYVLVNYTGYYADSLTGAATYGSNTPFGDENKGQNKTVYVFDDGTFTIKAGYANSGDTGFECKLENNGTTTKPVTTAGNTSATQTVQGKITITVSGSKQSSGGGTCVPAGTLVTLYDGTYVNVEDLKPTDRLLVFNHENGTWDIATINFIEPEQTAWYNVTHMYFSDGSTTAFVDVHGYFDIDLMKYVYITTENVQSYVGHKFYKATLVNGVYTSKIVTMVSAETTVEYTECYGIAPCYHLSFFADDFLSIEGGITGMFNFFDYDEDLRYNQEQMQQDIETYGLCTYDDFKDYMSYETYLQYPAKYINISLGKGLMTYDDLMYLIERYAQKYERDDVEPMAKGSDPPEPLTSGLPETALPIATTSNANTNGNGNNNTNSGGNGNNTNGDGNGNNDNTNDSSESDTNDELDDSNNIDSNNE